MEPFHELYPSQAAVFRIDVLYTELKEKLKEKDVIKNGTENDVIKQAPQYGYSWELDWDDIEAKAKLPQCKAMVLCDPHNPTGKVY